MSKSSLLERLCEKHKKQIIAFCFNFNCNQNRLACVNCLTEQLHIHQKEDFKMIETFEEILNQNNSQCSNLIAQLSKMIDEILFTFYSLRNGIEDKYNLSIKRTDTFSNDQINQYISNIIKLNKKSQEMKMNMENMCSDFLNKLRNLVIELQLDQLNYQISKENQERAEKLYQEGYFLYWDKKDYNGAIKLFDLSLIQNHQLPVWRLRRKGEALRLLGEYKESIEWFDKALAINSKHVDSLFGKGATLFWLDQMDKSIEWFDKALVIEPNSVDSLFGKGEA